MCLKGVNNGLRGNKDLEEKLKTRADDLKTLAGEVKLLAK